MNRVNQNLGQLTFRCPTANDGYAVNQLIAACPPLDTNSVYCNLLQCTHFSETCVVAELDGEMVGWMSAYINPQKSNTIFIWQMAVSEKVRGQSLAYKMLNHLLSRVVCSEVTHVETTITKDNQASRSVFRKLASQLNTGCAESSYFVRDIHLGGKHADEYLFKIGPISSNAKRMIKIKEENL